MSVDLFSAAYLEGWVPEPDLWVDEWADRYRILSAKGSAEPGQWRTSRTPYLRDIMRALSPQNPARRIVLMGGAQIAKTELGLNWIGYIIHHAPGPILMVEPTVQVARRVSKQRLAPMIQATPEIRDRVAPSRSRDSGNTTFEKEFAGDGTLVLTGANSAAGLRSMPIRYLFFDEVDEYPGDVEGQGDPVSLAEKRATTFRGRRKSLLTSTPTIKGLSRIEAAYLASDQERLFVQCPGCKHWDYMRWENFHWKENKPSTVRLHCVKCSLELRESDKEELVSGARWKPTAVGVEGTIGFHLPSFYSPWKTWEECADEFLAAKDDVFKLKTWINTVAGETWEERGDSVDAAVLAARREDYGPQGIVPNGVGILVAAVDVQADRLEVQVKGYGAQEESWLIGFARIDGDPERIGVWEELDRVLGATYRHESGRTLKIECAVVDSNYLADIVYRYVKARSHRRYYAVRGGKETGKPVVTRSTKRSNAYRANLFTLCTDTAKEIIYSRLRIPLGVSGQQPRPGYVHLPTWIDEEYCAQLAAEKAVRKYVKGRGSVRQWVPLRERNEALDLEVYSLAALYILEMLSNRAIVKSLPARAKKLEQKKGVRPLDIAKESEAIAKTAGDLVDALKDLAHPDEIHFPDEPKKIPRPQSRRRGKWSSGARGKWRP